MQYSHYALTKILATLKTCENDTQAAQRLIAKQVLEDADLLQGVAAPHLKSIISHAVLHAQRLEQKVHDAKPATQHAEVEKDMSGLGILQGAADNADQVFGRLSQQPVKPLKASQDHVNAIYQIAKKIDPEDKS